MQRLLDHVILFAATVSVATGITLVEFSPTATVRSFVGVPSTISWEVQASYSSTGFLESNNDDHGSPIIHIPVLFFPSTGTSTMSVGSHPCVIRSPTACCLIDFVEQYTSVGFYRYMQSQSSWLNRETCDGIQDVRPLVRGIYEAGLARDMVTGALDGILNTNIVVSEPSELHGVGSADVTVTIPHTVMRSLMSTPKNGSSQDTLVTFVGFMWLHTRPVASVTRGIEVAVLQRSVLLVLTGSFLTIGLSTSYDPTVCSMTPQGICILCTNRNIPVGAYYIYTAEGAATGECDFRCDAGTTYVPGPSPPGTATCDTCYELPTNCPVGSYAAVCTTTSQPVCEYCANLTTHQQNENDNGIMVCPESGYYEEFCSGGARVNPGCKRCSGAPVGGVYISGCTWGCGSGYTLAGTSTCVFDAQDEDRLAVSFQIFVQGVSPIEGLQPGEIAFQESGFKSAIASVVSGLDSGQVYVVKVDRVNATTIGSSSEPTQEFIGQLGSTSTTRDLSTNSGRRLARDSSTTISWPYQENENYDSRRQSVDNTAGKIYMIELGGGEVYTYVESYFWLQIGAGISNDPIQEILTGVFSGSVQQSMARSMSVSEGISLGFVSLPVYEPRLSMLRLIESLGGVPQGDGVPDVDPRQPIDPSLNNLKRKSISITDTCESSWFAAATVSGAAIVIVFVAALGT